MRPGNLRAISAGPISSLRQLIFYRNFIVLSVNLRKIFTNRFALSAVLLAAQGSAMAQEATANPYGLQAIWEQGDWVARSTLMILAIMSLLSWYVIVTKTMEQSRVKKQARAVQENFWTTPSLDQSAAQLEAASPYRFITDRGLESAQKHPGMLNNIDFNTWVTMSIQRAMASVQSRFQEGLSILATVGSTAPFVGLFGS